jgi:hypothetical protein
MTNIATRPGWYFEDATFLQTAAFCAEVGDVHQLEVISSRSHSITTHNITGVQLHPYIVRTALRNRVIFFVLLSPLLIGSNLPCDDKAEEISMFDRGLAIQP